MLCRQAFALSVSLLLTCCFSHAALAAGAPSVDQALGLKPTQKGVDYAKPTPQEAQQCKLEPEKRGSETAWVVRDADGQLLRRFSDTNADDLVDVWSYFDDGMEVYRDIDSDFNKKPDQYRWFHTAGARWGLDSNEDGRIDSWRVITAHEVAEELVEAIRQQDEQAFKALLISPKELGQLGLSSGLESQFRERLAGAVEGFQKLVRSQKTITDTSRFADFGAPRPGTIPKGADGAERDVTLYQSASALVDNGGKSEQVQLGAVVSLGDGAWRLVETPQVGSEGVELANVFGAPGATGPTAGGAAPSEKMTELMAQLEKLDQRLAQANPAERVKLVDQRGKLLRQLAEVTPQAEIRDQWYMQLADMLSAAVVEGYYPQGVKKLSRLADEVSKKRVGKDVLSHVRFQTIWADWGVRSQDPKQDYAKVQEAWLGQLKSFIKAHPGSPDSAEALLQLAMADEFAGQTEAAVKWYQRLAKEFAGADRGRKAAGALRRLDSLEKRIPLAGPTLGGGKADLGDYRGKHVLIHYWATWCEPCKADMAQIKELFAKYGGKGFAVVGVNLDTNAAAAEQYVQQKRLPWKHIYDEGGLDGRLANELGVMTLPLMILVDEQGRVVNRSIHAAELEAELQRVLR